MASTPHTPATPKGPVRPVTCYHCGHAFDIAARAMSSSCPKCSKPLNVQDVVVKTAHFVRKIQTCGRIIVEAKGQLNAAHIHAQLGVEVIGTVEGNVTCGGVVSIGPKAKWKGDCRSAALVVADGATITRGFFQVPFDPFAPENLSRGDDGDETEAAAAAPAAAPARSTLAPKAISTRRPRATEPASEAEAKPVQAAEPTESVDGAGEAQQPPDAEPAPEARPIKKITTTRKPPATPKVTIAKPPAKLPELGKPPKGSKKKKR